MKEYNKPHITMLHSFGLNQIAYQKFKCLLFALYVRFLTEAILSSEINVYSQASQPYVTLTQVFGECNTLI